MLSSFKHKQNMLSCDPCFCLHFLHLIRSCVICDEFSCDIHYHYSSNHFYVFMLRCLIVPGVDKLFQMSYTFYMLICNLLLPISLGIKRYVILLYSVIL